MSNRDRELSVPSLSLCLSPHPIAGYCLLLHSIRPEHDISLMTHRHSFVNHEDLPCCDPVDDYSTIFAPSIAFAIHKCTCGTENPEEMDSGQERVEACSAYAD